MNIIVCIANNKGISFNGRAVSRDEVVAQDIEDNYAAGYVRYDKEQHELSQINEIVLYKWNRDYPADAFFDFNKKEFERVSTIDFPGKSHDRITKEVWIRK